MIKGSLIGVEAGAEATSIHQSINGEKKAIGIRKREAEKVRRSMIRRHTTPSI